MLLPTETPTNIQAGDYMVIADVPTGTATIQVNKDGLGFQTVQDSNGDISWLADANGILTFTDCDIQSVLTGTAQVSIDRIENKGQ